MLHLELLIRGSKLRGMDGVGDGSRVLRVALSLGFVVIAPFKGEDRFHRDRSEKTPLPMW